MGGQSTVWLARRTACLISCATNAEEIAIHGRVVEGDGSGSRVKSMATLGLHECSPRVLIVGTSTAAAAMPSGTTNDSPAERMIRTIDSNSRD